MAKERQNYALQAIKVDHELTLDVSVKIGILKVPNFLFTSPVMHGGNTSRNEFLPPYIIPIPLKILDRIDLSNDIRLMVN